MWAATSVYRLGATTVGVRSSSAELDRVLQRALAAYLATEEPPQPHYSLLLGGTGSPEGRRLNILYRSNRIVTRARNVHRVVRALCAHLSSYLDDGGGCVLLRGVVVLGPAGAVIAQEGWRRFIVEGEARLNDIGWQLSDDPLARVDAATGEVVLADPPLSVDPLMLEAALNFRAVGSTVRPTAPSGRYPLLALMRLESGSPGRARRLAALASESVNPGPIGPDRTLQVLDRVLGSARILTPEELSSLALVRALAALD